MSTEKKNPDSKTRGAWTMTADELFAKLGLPLPTGKPKKGSFIKPARKL